MYDLFSRDGYWCSVSLPYVDLQKQPQKKIFCTPLFKCMHTCTLHVYICNMCYHNGCTECFGEVAILHVHVAIKNILWSQYLTLGMMCTVQEK